MLKNESNNVLLETHASRHILIDILQAISSPRQIHDTLRTINDRARLACSIKLGNKASQGERWPIMAKKHRSRFGELRRINVEHGSLLNDCCHSRFLPGCYQQFRGEYIIPLLGLETPAGVLSQLAFIKARSNRYTPSAPRPIYRETLAESPSFPDKNFRDALRQNWVSIEEGSIGGIVAGDS